MARRKLSDAQRQALQRQLLKEVSRSKGENLMPIFKRIGKRFGVSSETVRYYAKVAKESTPDAASFGRVRKVRPGQLRAAMDVPLAREVRSLLRRAKELRREAEVCRREHLRKAKECERAAARLAKM